MLVFWQVLFLDFDFKGIFIKKDICCWQVYDVDVLCDLILEGYFKKVVILSYGRLLVMSCRILVIRDLYFMYNI